MTALAPFMFWSFVTVAIVLAVVGQVVSKLVRFVVMRRDPALKIGSKTKTVEEVLYRASAPPPEAVTTTAITIEVPAGGSVVVPAQVRLTPVPSAPLPMWLRIFILTLPLHPIAAGAALGATRVLPVHSAVGDNPWVNAAYFGFAGCISGSVYDFLSKWAARKLGR